MRKNILYHVRAFDFSNGAVVTKVFLKTKDGMLKHRGLFVKIKKADKGEGFYLSPYGRLAGKNNWFLYKANKFHLVKKHHVKVF